VRSYLCLPHQGFVLLQVAQDDEVVVGVEAVQELRLLVLVGRVDDLAVRETSSVHREEKPY